MKRDNSSEIVEDIKWTLFNNRDYDLSFQFDEWVGDGHTITVKDKDETEYSVNVELIYRIHVKKDNSSEIIKNIKRTLFDNRNNNLSFQFDEWVGHRHTFIIIDEDEIQYRVTVKKVIL